MSSDSFSVLTYNLEFNRALDVLPKIIQKYQPDVVCLQEVAIDKPKFKDFSLAGYALAGASGCFYRMGKTYGQATFYRQDKFLLTESKSIMLPKAFYEILITLLTGKGPRTALCTDFTVNNLTRKKLSIYNLHLTALVAANGARIKQLNETLGSIDLDPTRNTVVLGDFNYPFRKKTLERVVGKYGLNEATSNLTRTYRAQPWRFLERVINIVFPVSLKYDFILNSKGLRLVETKMLEEFVASDHYPVLSVFRF